MRHFYRFFTVAALALALSACTSDPFKKLNAQADGEYLVPIRPGYEGRNPYWNIYAPKFTYAPAFGFETVDGAVKYRFSIFDRRNADNRWSFVADSPNASLAPVWNDIYPADVHLSVEALDKDGNVLAIAGERDFLRDFPFHGPYPGNTRPYREAAMRAALYTHRMPAVQSWKTCSTEPDLSYQLNAYPNKITGATIRNEVFIARSIPALRDEALLIARNAAAFLLSQRFPAGHPLEFFPPTFYGDKASSGWSDNQGTTMVMDACMGGLGFLDLFAETGDSLYFDAAVKIADTYRNIQAEDGSFPIKVNITTGIPINNSKAMLYPVLEYLGRLDKEFGVKGYEEVTRKCIDWMEKVAIETFDITGQFEDTYHGGAKPYQNLTNCTASDYANYILRSGNPTEKQIADALDLIRMSEDQFVRWNFLPNDVTGVRDNYSPCTYEQYFCYKPVDASSANMANAYMSYYELTGDRLSLEKARALMDQIENLQDETTGMIRSIDEPVEYFWINCNYHCIYTFIRLADILGE